MKSSAYYVHVKTKIEVDFQIYIGVLLSKVFQKPWKSFRIFSSMSMKYFPMTIEKTLLMYRCCITKRSREIWQRLTNFWIKINDRLFECLQLSESTACCQKSRCDHFLALCILWKNFTIHADAKAWSHY